MGTRRMTIVEAATDLGLSPDTLRSQIRNGVLRASKFGPVWTVTEAEVDRYRATRLGKLGRKSA